MQKVQHGIKGSGFETLRRRDLIAGDVLFLSTKTCYLCPSVISKTSTRPTQTVSWQQGSHGDKSFGSLTCRK